MHLTDYEIPDEVYDPLAEALKMQAENARLHSICARLRAELDAEREKQRWIPVGERLPEKGVTVLIYTIDGETKEAHLSCYSDLWSDDEDVYVLKDITHWRELPTPPESERE